MKLYIITEQNDQNATHPYVRYGLENTLLVPFLVGGFKHFFFSISYMGCHPSKRTFICFKMVKTTNQMM